MVPKFLWLRMQKISICINKKSFIISYIIEVLHFSRSWSTNINQIENWLCHNVQYSITSQITWSIDTRSHWKYCRLALDKIWLLYTRSKKRLKVVNGEVIGNQSKEEREATQNISVSDFAMTDKYPWPYFNYIPTSILKKFIESNKK